MRIQGAGVCVATGSPRYAAVVYLLLVVGSWGCGGPKHSNVPASYHVEYPASDPSEGVRPSDRIERISEPAVRSDGAARWVWIEQVRKGAADGRATGSFDTKRNKLSVQTRNARRFAVDVSLIPIDWRRPVILGIDGKNSELRRRDYNVLHFLRDQYGRWVIVEP